MESFFMKCNEFYIHFSNPSTPPFLRPDVEYLILREE